MRVPISREVDSEDAMGQAIYWRIFRKEVDATGLPLDHEKGLDVHGSVATNGSSA